MKASESHLLQLIRNVAPPGTPVETLMTIRNQVASDLAAFLNSMKLPPMVLVKVDTNQPTSSFTLSRGEELLLAYDESNGIVYRNRDDAPSYPYTYKGQFVQGSGSIVYTTDDGRAIYWITRIIYNPTTVNLLLLGTPTDIPYGAEPLALALARAFINPTPQALAAVNDARRAISRQAEGEWRTRFPQLFQPDSPLHQPDRKPYIYRRRIPW